MRRLLSGLAIIAVLSQVPQVSAAFGEEKQGIEAAYGKIVKAYKGTVTIYDKTRDDIALIQGRLAKVREDVDNHKAHVDNAGTEVSKYYKGLRTLAKERAENIRGALNLSSEEGYSTNSSNYR
ncbi:MAG: hypothetical protein IBX64_02660 [Actinobacteria bacterium]|nr:hypothetical protein [Actinomycetota bacterium]